MPSFTSTVREPSSRSSVGRAGKMRSRRRPTRSLYRCSLLVVRWQSVVPKLEEVRRKLRVDRCDGLLGKRSLRCAEHREHDANGVLGSHSEMFAYVTQQLVATKDRSGLFPMLRAAFDESPEPSRQSKKEVPRLTTAESPRKRAHDGAERSPGR